MASIPIPVPTPYQPQSYGGNPYLLPGTTGQALSSSAIPVSSNPQYTTFNSGAVYPSSNVINYSPATSGAVQGATTTAPQQTAPTGGGGGTGSGSAPVPTGDGGNTDLNSSLDAIFNPVFSALSGQESTLRENYAPVEGQIQAQGALSQQSLADQQASGMRELTGQEAAAGTRKEDALTSATRLYDELKRGGQQRFGGSSSAGEAYQTLTATEQQRRQGTIQTAYETAMQQVGQFKANLQDKYQTAVKEVTLQTQQAITDAQSQFRDALQSIRNAQSAAQSDKATASMNLLQDLRNKVYTINQQSLQFAQQLALNHEMTLKQVSAYEQKALSYLTGGQQALASNPLTNYTANTAYGTNAGQVAAPSTYQAGQITKKKEEEYP
jgi:hypothetical protein